ncbi:MAG: response regulator transcription factor [bacterium]
MDKKIRIIIADDSKLTVVGLKTTFKHFIDIEVVGVAENGLLAIESVKELNPDIILLDIGMPIMDGIQAVKEIKKLKNPPGIIMLTSHDGENDVLEALSAGANSYCTKDIDPNILVSVIKTTYNGASWLDPQIARIVLNNLANKNKHIKLQENSLTEREVDVLSLIAKGCSNNEISQQLYISLNTVKTHLKNIFQKLEVEDRTQAALKAMQEELIPKEI